MSAPQRARAVLAGVALALAVVACGPSPSAAPGNPGTDPSAAPPDPSIVAARRSAGLPLFADNPGAPLDVVITPDPADTTALATVAELTYSGARGDTVTALLVQPVAQSQHPAVIMLSGLPGTRRDLLPRALDFASAGVLSLLVDAPHARAARLGPGTQPLNFTAQDRDEQIQLIVDLRRAVDLLAARPDVDPFAIGFFGASYGASMGGLFAGVEPRLAAAVLESGDGGLVSHFAALGDASPLAGLSPAARDAWLAAMEPIEPLYFVGNASGPVLFQAGRLDPVSTPAEQVRFAAAGNAQSSITWYDAGHGLGQPAWCDAAHWLGDHLGFDGSGATACGPAAPQDSSSWIAIIGLFLILIGVRLALRLRRRPPPPPPDDEDDDPNAYTPPIIRPAER